MATGKAISGNPTRNGTGETLLLVDVALGQNKPANNAADQFIKGDEATDPWGRRGNLEPQGTHQAVNDRVTSLPSGWTPTFAIDVGEGLFVTNTVWATDQQVETKGQYAFYKPFGAATGNYSALTS